MKQYIRLRFSTQSSLLSQMMVWVVIAEIRNLGKTDKNHLNILGKADK